MWCIPGSTTEGNPKELGSNPILAIMGGVYMCKFCEMPTKELKFHRQETDTNITECFIHKASDGYSIMLRQGMKVSFTDRFGVKINQDNQYAYLEINFCPICGRKLEG